MVGGNNSFSRSSVSPGVGGTSTYQWQWVPPNNAAGKPDLTDFPAPPLYVLGWINLKVDAISYDDPGNGTGYVGLSGSAKAADGWGYSDSITKMPGHIPAAGISPIHRHVLGPATASVANVAVTLSPSASGSVTGTQSGNRGGLYVNLAESVFPITLAAPNPLTNPLLGDGTNQFVYDTHQPDGILVLPASASVPGAETADTTFLLSHVTLPVTPMVPHTLPSTLTASGSSIVVSTAGHYPDPDTATSYPAASYIAKGLPATNSDFGNHVVTLTVDGKASQFANCQTFYTGSTSNWPGSIGTVQNWYD